MTDEHGPRPYQPPEAVDQARARWFYRRLVAFGSFLTVGGLLIFTALAGNDGMFGTAMFGFCALVTSYLGLPVADDFLQRTAARAR